jgi:hypothetical protein
MCTNSITIPDMPSSNVSLQLALGSGGLVSEVSSRSGSLNLIEAHKLT